MGYAKASIGGRVQVPQLHSPGRFLPFLSGTVPLSSPQEKESPVSVMQAGLLKLRITV